MKADGDRYLEAGARFEPKTTEDYYNIGCAYYYLEEQDEAVKAFSKAMKRRQQRGDGNARRGLPFQWSERRGESTVFFVSFDRWLCGGSKQRAGALRTCGKRHGQCTLVYRGRTQNGRGFRPGKVCCFNQIVSYEKRADFDTAKSPMADFLAAYPENTAAQRENTFLQNR